MKFTTPVWTLRHRLSLGIGNVLDGMPTYTPVNTE